MKIVDVRVTPVLVPLVTPLRWSAGTELGTTRTIVELVTDEGLVGLGETRGGEAVAAAVRQTASFFLGLDPVEALRVAKRYGFYRVTSEQLDIIGATKLAGAAVEMACWDLAGKQLGKRCGDLWGGIDREEIEFAAYVFYRQGSADEELTVDHPAEHAVELVDRYGFRDVKFKNGILPPEQELVAVEKIRASLGDRMRFLRLDPNQAWSVPTSTRFLRAVAAFDVEFCEDPTWGIEGMSLVRKDSPVPLATNMCCVSFDQLPQTIREHAVDVILGDIHFWGGPSALGHLAKICETFNLGMSLHSDRELGISTAALLHFAAAHPVVSHSIDSHLPEQSDDVIAEPHRFRDGRLPVPAGAGLGVELDRDKLEEYHRRYVEQEFQDEFRDPFRPEWWPSLPIF
ncbi:enolase C-terminal domain-like protein [Jiangella anatolica]|uniref:glucarate dehydratase n=1 Tax=Jiangella anatolica TaxID=2670374 RepID=A0A2W2BN15_9ACTN|nr:enolase C-terminal domain-like protein [Jiangella anatolica]PZF86680.1 mandelate racemase [Jiangella anatolica]